MTSADLLGLIASAVFLVRLVPQPLRLARTGVADGVSPLSTLNAVIAALAWLVYGLMAGLPIVWVVSAFALVPGVWAVVLMSARVTARDVALAAAWVGALVVAALTGTFAAALGFGVLVTQGPQVLDAMRQDDLDGLAPATWWISLLDAGTWGAYGLAVGDPALLGYAVVLSTSAVVVLVRIDRCRRRSRTRAVAAAGVEGAMAADPAVDQLPLGVEPGSLPLGVVRDL